MTNPCRLQELHSPVGAEVTCCSDGVIKVHFLINVINHSVDLLIVSV